VCLDGQRALVPNESQVANLTVAGGKVAPIWGDLDLPSTLELNKFNSKTYFTYLALGQIAEAETNYKNSNEYFYAPMAEDGDFREETNFPLLAVSYANWDCDQESLTILVHTIGGAKISTESPLNTVTIGGVPFDPQEGSYILDVGGNPIGFQVVASMVGCDFCESIVIQASVEGRLATTGQYPELDVALQCCPEPSDAPSSAPTVSPTVLPTGTPSVAPTNVPSASPSVLPSHPPTIGPSSQPSALPSSSPSSDPTVSSAPSSHPTLSPSDRPSSTPSQSPSVSVKPSAGPSVSVAPSVGPTKLPSEQPTIHPTDPLTTPHPTISFAPSTHPLQPPTIPPTNKPQVCFPFRHPKFFPYRVEVWSGETISRSDKNVCSPKKAKMYGYDPYKYHPYKPLPAYPFQKKYP
jgi:hypothetical protein